MLLDALFKNCPFVNIQQNGTTTSIADDASTVARRLRIPDHTPIIFSEIAGRTLYRIDYKDTGREEEQQQLTNLLPLWIIDPIVNVCSTPLTPLVGLIDFLLLLLLFSKRKTFPSSTKSFSCSIRIRLVRVPSWQQTSRFDPWLDQSKYSGSCYWLSIAETS
jgi:hypothetical protein